MRQHQDIVFTGKISQAEGHAVVAVFAEIGIQLHVFQEIVHPAHIPLKGKSEAVPLRVFCHAGPGAVAIGRPLSLLASVVQVEHGGHSIHTQAVHMVLLHPVKGVADQEVLNLIFSVVKYPGSPVGMFTLFWILIFI